ncbi:hypothetical protein EYF80_007157 [Liparis tanakae]|uniref:Uncharacterized protein n=1 Tax=Liparis tanakae TaxID=230148 RepID=A0A4Z2IXB8_9TELE|nr:hypothetical protein EYF80_007157 [Liparis tanakae]
MWAAGGAGLIRGLGSPDSTQTERGIIARLWKKVSAVNVIRSCLFIKSCDSEMWTVMFSSSSCVNTTLRLSALLSLLSVQHLCRLEFVGPRQKLSFPRVRDSRVSVRLRYVAQPAGESRSDGCPADLGSEFNLSNREEPGAD